MNFIKVVSVVVLVGSTAVLVRCHDEKPQYLTRDPACAGIDEITDPQVKAELEKKCPNAGIFKPSKKIDW